MKRNIITTIKFASGKISIIVLEKISTNIVELFNSFSDIQKIYEFLEKSFQTITSIIGGKLSEVGVIIEPSYRTKAKIDIYCQEMQIVGDSITKQDVDNILELTKKKFKSEHQKVILVQPIKFDVQDIITKSYNKAPIFKKGNKLFATSAVTTIASEVYDYINQVIRSQGLVISQILLSPQAISQSNISKSALSKGSILIHIGESQTFMTTNKNLATISAFLIYDFGYKNLLQGIAKLFRCTKEEAANLILVYGLFDHFDKKNQNRVIYTYQDGSNKTIHYAYELNKIIEVFIGKLNISINKFIEQKNITNLPIVLSGKLNNVVNIENFLKNTMKNELISLYNPISFIEMNEINIETLGFEKFMNRIDELLGKEFNTIVETNPNAISSIKKQNNQKNKKWYAKIINILGGKYEWN